MGGPSNKLTGAHLNRAHVDAVSRWWTSERIANTRKRNSDGKGSGGLVLALNQRRKDGETTFESSRPIGDFSNFALCAFAPRDGWTNAMLPRIELFFFPFSTCVFNFENTS